ncbi:MAG: hypothetical protein F4Y82_02385 [Cenarchaeum sp. SB0665_bin_23]|nr:hypothetical protein [Cenarchaeum sp. SB0667_bin_13]MXY60950.1 hypothetical protein [Cenarchaeum sp. SB0665_bin_23]MXZ93170.1 hypothetical protein [Cenarchaeum sp. SB0666_bin_15]MYB46255.1 hypothetical protein [Cenarchaeum sp. SB0662_bin_33]MYC80048.1 hypothetical protein [Cenarchaeum sp. SB0661_bin_35]MYG33574.1 hypothetical protein [Cenarchaeum sp. SB0677_bin_16]MYI51482.1 hypothetical protein [Cenarchaeum sp. SB0673_bin_9]MYJ27300.1 hypothetical protein [Cenarchaeum sp. SB0672_bin_9]
MSLFDEDSDTRTSINFFNMLNDEERALIVSDLNPETFKIPQYYDDLVPLLSRVQMDIIKHDGIKVGNRLMELGLEETWARLIVSNMKKHAPTIKYQVSQIEKMSDKKFDESFSKIMDSLWMDKIDKNLIVEKFGIDQEQLNCIIDMTGHYMQDIMRGDNTEKQIRDMLLENGLSKSKVDTMMRSVMLLERGWYRWLLFRNTQDGLYNIQEIKEQNTYILETLREILVLLKGPKFDRGV